MKTKIYEYIKCSTCRDALKFLDSKAVSYERIAIVDQPPSIAELKRMLSYLVAENGSIKNLFNISGQQYRELKIAEKFKAGMNETEALKILATNGKLIKRPFLLSEKIGFVGFKKDDWSKALPLLKK